MIKKIVLSFVAILVLAAAAGAAYVYYYAGYPWAMQNPTGTLPPQAAPDNAVVAGPVKAVSATGISITKQDGTSATLTVNSTTQVVMAGTQGQAAAKKITDIKVGMLVLITPSASDATVAQTIVIVTAPPTQ